MAKITVRTLAEGERIRETGIYRISEDDYHNRKDLCVAPSISSSGLVDLAKDPRGFWRKSVYNPDAKPQPQKHKFSYGHACHELILEGDLSKDRYAVRPAHWKNWKSKDSQIWRDAHIAQGYEVLTPEDLENLVGMAETIKDHPVASELFKSGLVEVSLFVKFGGIFIRARPDIIPLFNAMSINDYKSCTDSSRGALNYQIENLRYDAKLANVAWCLKQCIPDIPAEDLDYSLTFQEKTDPWSINIVPITSEQIRNRMAENLGAARMFDEHILDGSFPHKEIEYDDPYQLPPWKLDKIRNRIREGELPTLDENFDIIDPYGDQT